MEFIEEHRLPVRERFVEQSLEAALVRKASVRV
jgi:hypothetical protein